VFASGTIYDAAQAFAVVKLNGADGTLGPIPGKKLLVRDKAADSAKRRIVALSQDPFISTPAPGGPHDPRMNGAKLRLVGMFDDVSFTLPAGPLWRGLGNPSGSQGYRYVDRTGSNGPCTLLLAKPGTRLKAVCNGRLGPIPFTLDEPTQSTLTLSVRFGTAEPQCIAFGGSILRNAGVTNPGPVGLFKAIDSPPPAQSCPVP
jgi:hypothetical protein